MHYYQHHIGDFIKATARLSDSQAMGYLRLLWMYYDSEKPLNKDVEVLAFQIGATIEDTNLLLRSFFVYRETGWHQTRCDNEIQEYREFLDKKSNAGKASAQRRKNNSSTDVQQVLNSGSTVEQLTTNQQPLTTNHKPKRESATVVATPEGVTESVWQDFVKHRKAKKAPITPTALAGIKREADKASWSLDRAITECVERGWIAFKADWVAPKQSFAQQAADVARTTVPAQHIGPDPVLLKIQQDRLRAVPPTIEQLEKMAALRRSIAK
jgi:uncharacterized protein YdaU (DUF1376 family)